LASSAFCAIGFSTSTDKPASSASRTIGIRTEGGVQTRTPFTSIASAVCKNCSKLANGFAPAESAALWRADSSGSITALKPMRPFANAFAAAMCTRAIPPLPTMASFT
jgi:hypothetical protein